MAGDWETLQEEHTIRTHALTSQRSSKMAPNPTPPPSAQLCHTHAFAHVGKYVEVVCALGPKLLWPHQLRPLQPFAIFIHWLKLTSPLLLMIFILKQILFQIEKHLFLLSHVHQFFRPMIF